MARNNFLTSRLRNDIEPFSLLREDVDKLFSNVVSNWSPFYRENYLSLTPAIDVNESKNDYIITAELPGIDEKDINLELQNNILTLKGEKKIEREEKEKNYHIIERSSGNFRRSLQIPCSIDDTKINATFKNGVLTIVLPKSADNKSESKRIEINS